MIMVDDSINAEMLAARAKLRERFGTPQQIGGKGTARRKTKKTHKSVVADDKKLQVTLKRLSVSQIYGIEEVFMLKEDGMALHFSNPKVQAAPACNTYVVSGHFEERPNPSALLGMQNFGGRGPGALNIDPSLFTPEMLRQLQQQVTAMSAANAEQNKTGTHADDDEVPDLQVNFEEVSKE